MLAGISEAALQNMDSEDGALELLGEMSDILQESLTFLVDMMCEHITAAAADLDSIAEVLSSAITPAPSEDHAMLFAYNLILYWQENT